MHRLRYYCATRSPALQFSLDLGLHSWMRMAVMHSHDSNARALHSSLLCGVLATALLGTPAYCQYPAAVEGQALFYGGPEVRTSCKQYVCIVYSGT